VEVAADCPAPATASIAPSPKRMSSPASACPATSPPASPSVSDANPAPLRDTCDRLVPSSAGNAEAKKASTVPTAPPRCFARLRTRSASCCPCSPLSACPSAFGSVMSTPSSIRYCASAAFSSTLALPTNAPADEPAFAPAGPKTLPASAPSDVVRIDGSDCSDEDVTRLYALPAPPCSSCESAPATASPCVLPSLVASACAAATRGSRGSSRICRV
jgi:hypothetical protein